MEKQQPAQNTGKWLFHLQQEQTLRFSIVSDQEAGHQILIEGHEISALLDYLYDHRDMIYDATHDQELSSLEASEAHSHHERVAAARPQTRSVQPIRYLDDGIQRTRANF